MKQVLLVGTGNIARDYVKVLNDLNVSFDVIGRSDKSCQQFTQDTGIKATSGGVQAANIQFGKYDSAIIAVDASQLVPVANDLMALGIKKILLEKPGAISKTEFSDMVKRGNDNQVKLYIAYNRRFYASLLNAERIIELDGGLLSMYFEFTEWPHTVIKSGLPEETLKNWFLCNSTHIIDMAFYFGGVPKRIECYSDGMQNWTDEHERFVGAGITEKGVFFNYGSNWNAPGRWKVELMTKNNRLIFAPIEKLQIQKRGTVRVELDETVDYTLDINYKPGLYLETATFLGFYPEYLKKLKTAQEQLNMFPIYEQIAGREYR